MVDHSSRRLLQIKNPWSRGGIPGSSFSTTELKSTLQSIDESSPDLPCDPSLGTFWTEYSTLSRTFKTLYLNWSPARFESVRHKHFSFIPNGSDFDISSNGQYTISVEGTGDVWIVVERHYLGKSEAWNGYVGLAVFPGDKRVYSYTRPIYRVPSLYSNLTVDRICRRKSYATEDPQISSNYTTHRRGYCK
jgi:hypothetical protein